jgi:hypothetical protein
MNQRAEDREDYCRKGFAAMARSSRLSNGTYPLRLPRSVNAEVERRAKEDGISVNQFIATAVAEKLAVMNTAAFFAERRARADFKAFDRLMRRKGGVPPAPEDEMREATPARLRGEGPLPGLTRRSTRGSGAKSAG